MENIWQEVVGAIPVGAVPTGWNAQAWGEFREIPQVLVEPVEHTI